MSRRVLVVDDEPSVYQPLRGRLRADGCDVIEAGTGAEAIARAGDGVDLVILDQTVAGVDRVAILTRLREGDPDTPIIMTLPADSPVADDAMRAGAFDCVVRPFDLDDIARRVARALEVSHLRREVRQLRARFLSPATVDAIVGGSAAIERVRMLARKIAASSGSTVLIAGEFGTGKHLVARVIHEGGARASRPFLSLACAAMPESELEAALFGRAREWSVQPQPPRGVLEQAEGGTVLLRDVDALTPGLQAQVLRLLQDRAFRRVNGTSDVAADVRIIATTRDDLEERVQAGTFRSDLYYRLNALRIDIPPLRARRDDVAPLALLFIARAAAELGRSAPRFGESAAAALVAHVWPGNVRELNNLIERAVLLAADGTLTSADFDALRSARPHGGSHHGGVELPLAGVNLDDVEKRLVTQALERAGGNQTRAAALLGLHRDQIRYRIEKFGLGKKH